MLRDGGDGRGEKAEDVQVVEGDERDALIADGPSGVTEVAERAEGVPGVSEEDRGGPVPEERVELAEPVVAVQRRRDDHARRAGQERIAGVVEGEKAFAPGRGAEQGADVDDLLVAEIPEGLHRRVHAGKGIGVHGRGLEPVERAVDGDEGDLLVPEPVEHRRHPAEWDDDQAVDLFLQEGAQVLVLLVRVLLRGGDEDREAVCEALRLDGLGEAGEEGVADVGHDQADRIRPGGPQRAGPQVDLVAEGEGGCTDLLACGWGCGRVVGQDP